MCELSITVSPEDKLREIQKREGYTDLQMARLIDCSRQLYQMTRTGKVKMGTKILKGAARAFPEFYPYAYIFLIGNANRISDLLITDTPEKQRYSPFQRLLKRIRGVR